jgi:hypothetical protein
MEMYLFFLAQKRFRISSYLFLSHHRDVFVFLGTKRISPSRQSGQRRGEPVINNLTITSVHSHNSVSQFHFPCPKR